MIKISDPFLRTKMLIGDESFEKLRSSHIAIFGIGGVGSFTAEAIARSGILNIDLFDSDVVDITNINRQIIADFTTIGYAKVDVMKERIENINPKANINAIKCFFDENNVDQYDFSKYDYIVDAIDTISSKVLLIEKAIKEKVPIISSMGTGNKMNPLDFEVCDIYKTSVCPLARIIRQKLKQRGVEKLKVVYSKEKPQKFTAKINEEYKRINASISFVPSVAGLILAGEVIKDLIVNS